MKTFAAEFLARFVLASALALGAGLPLSAQTTIFQDNFNRTGNLSGSTPTTTTGGATWTVNGFSGTPWTTDGSKLSVTMWGDFAKLPFTPTNGTTYRIMLDVTVSGGAASDFVGVGFSTDNPLNYLLQAGSPWIAYTNASGIQAWAGKGQTNSVYDGDPTWVTNSATLRIDYALSADGSTSTASYYVDDIQVGTPYTYASAPAINAVFLTTKLYGAGATFDNFSLTTVAVPEPAVGIMVAGVLSFGFCLWRRLGHRRA